MAVWQVSPACAEDALEVAQLHVCAWRAAYADIIPAQYLAQLSVETRAAQWRETIASGSPRLSLAREEPLEPAPAGRPPALGFVCYGRCRDPDLPELWGEIWAIYVQPSHWSRGIGQALWRHACEQLRRDGFRHVSLWVLADNERAIRFYRRAGLELDSGARRGGTALPEERYRAALLTN
jgi:ribosomal protein S18 acetylase RimI-like enzyme